MKKKAVYELEAKKCHFGVASYLIGRQVAIAAELFLNLWE
jgi:hypothetical protein